MPEQQRYPHPAAGMTSSNSTGPMTLTASAPRPPSEVDSQLSNLSGALHHLHSKLSLLADRLQPVLDMRERATGKDSPEKDFAPASPIAQSIQQKTREVASAIEIVEALTDRLTV